MGVYMIERQMLAARWAFAATVAVMAVFAMDVLGCSSSEREFPDSGWPFKQQGVWNTVGVYHRSYAFFGSFMGGDIGKFLSVYMLVLQLFPRFGWRLMNKNVCSGPDVR